MRNLSLREPNHIPGAGSLVLSAGFNIPAEGFGFRNDKPQESGLAMKTVSDTRLGYVHDTLWTGSAMCITAEVIY